MVKTALKLISPYILYIIFIYMTPLKHTYCIWIASAPFCWLYGTRWCRLSAAPAVSVAANPSRSQTLRFGLRAAQCIRGENAASRRISLSKSVLNICWSLISTISNLTFLPCPTILEDDIDLILQKLSQIGWQFHIFALGIGYRVRQNEWQ